MPIVSGTSYTATGLTPGTTYTATVTALRGAERGKPATVDFTVKAAAPGKPTALAFDTGGNPAKGGAKVKFTPGTPAGTTYVLERKPKSGGSFAKVAEGAASPLTDPGPLTASTAYQWRVGASVEGSDVTYSDALEGSVPADPVKLATPAPSSKGTPEATTFAVEWAAVANVDPTKPNANGKGYAVDITPTGPTISAVDISTPAKPFVTITGATAETEYTVGVIAKGNGTAYVDSDKGDVGVTTAAAAAQDTKSAKGK